MRGFDYQFAASVGMGQADAPVVKAESSVDGAFLPRSVKRIPEYGRSRSGEMAAYLVPLAPRYFNFNPIITASGQGSR